MQLCPELLDFSFVIKKIGSRTGRYVMDGKWNIFQ